MGERRVRPIGEISKETREELQSLVVLFGSLADGTKRIYEKLHIEQRKDGGVAKEIYGQYYTWQHAAELVRERLLPPNSGQASIVRNSIFTSRMLQIMGTQMPGENFDSPTLDQIIGKTEDGDETE